jgi:hypothetical protein
VVLDGAGTGRLGVVFLVEITDIADESQGDAPR